MVSSLVMQMVQAFTHTAAVVDGDKGGKFQLLEGSVNGEFLELVRTRICLRSCSVDHDPLVEKYQI